jgi:cytochrome b561
LRPAVSRYSTVAIILHWVIAALILANIALAFTFDSKAGMEKFAAIQLHKSLGISILLLSVLRLGWRLTHAAPPLPADTPAWQALAAKATHWGFYALMIGIPLSGWVLVSASKYNLPTLLFSKVPWPHIGMISTLPAVQKAAVDAAAVQAHHLLAYAMIALIILHVLAALKHHFWDSDEVLGHMIPVAKSRSENP